MVIIKCSEYEKNEFIRVLEYAKEQKKLNRDAKSYKEKFDSTDYDIERINVLIRRVNGNYHENYRRTSPKASEREVSSEGLIKIM